ncbi:efflux RND transporter periplasmic adaptor subunit, partial [bacterium]
LIPLAMDDDGEAGPTTLVMSESAAALARIRTAPVVRGAAAAEVRLVGAVAYDETRNRTITAWVSGRIDTLFVDFTGTTVAAGGRLVSLYSPDLFAAQTELLNAIEADRSVSRSNSDLLRETSAATIESARRRLNLWGLDDEQIAAVERRGYASHHITIPSPLGGVVVHKDAIEGMFVQPGTRLFTVADLRGVWVEMDAYEKDLVWLREGQDIRFSVEALPGETFEAPVIFIDPVLDTRKRTVRIRLAADNADGRLKPGMFVKAVVSATLSEGDDPLMIPASAPLITGKRAVVYVQLPDRDKPSFEGREVELGPRAGDSYVVIAGLEEGEMVVVNGNFKIDSALQIQAKPSMMNPAGGGAPPAHHHGGAPVRVEADVAPTVTFTPPMAFTNQLDDVLSAYLAAQVALAADDAPAAAAAAADVSAALDGVDMSLLDHEAHLAWMEDLPPLQRTAATFANADDIESRRMALAGLSDNLWRSLERFGVSRTGSVRLFHCPMAFDNKGADWLQLATETVNPYFGASMLRCGSQTDSLTTTTDQEL